MADETVTCGTCGATDQIVGKFCEQCGTRVTAASADPAPTDLDAASGEGPTNDDAPATVDSAASADAGSGQADGEGRRFIRLDGGTFQAEHAFDVPIGAKLLVGRTDPANGVFPEVDVTMWARRVATSQGELYTIHRKQCYISRDDDGELWIVDHPGYEGDTLVAPEGVSNFQTIPALQTERPSNDEGAVQLEVGDRVLMGQGEGMLIFQLVAL